MTVQADIDLTDDERELFGQITFDWDFRKHDPDGFARTGEAVAQLITALLDRNAIPEHRLKYFTDPDYRKGRIKGSRRDLFRRNGRTDDEILRHPHFLEHARYFVCGPELPDALIREFREAVKGCGHVSLEKPSIWPTLRVVRSVLSDSGPTMQQKGISSSRSTAACG